MFRNKREATPATHISIELSTLTPKQRAKLGEYSRFVNDVLPIEGTPTADQLKELKRLRDQSITILTTAKKRTLSKRLAELD